MNDKIKEVVCVLNEKELPGHGAGINIHQTMMGLMTLKNILNKYNFSSHMLYIIFPHLDSA
jgi:hypothetical protein